MKHLTREQIKIINEIAAVDFSKARGMLDGANMVLGTKYGFSKRRVVVFDNPDGSVAERYAHFHDAYTIAEE